MENGNPGELRLTWGEIPDDKKNGVINEYDTECIYQCEINCTNQNTVEVCDFYSVWVKIKYLFITYSLLFGS